MEYEVEVEEVVVHKVTVSAGSTLLAHIKAKQMVKDGIIPCVDETLAPNVTRLASLSIRSVVKAKKED
jgi:hypothetical protein